MPRVAVFLRRDIQCLVWRALRERSEDIPLLVRHFVDLCAKRMNKQVERTPR